MITEADVLKALERIPGADCKTPLTPSNGISGLTIRNRKVYLALTGDPRLGQAMEKMRIDAERTVKELTDVIGVAVSLEVIKNVRQSGVSDNRPPPPSNGIHGISRIVAIASGKGGVGKSTTATNVAVALAKHGWKIGILDADVFGPSLPRLLGLDSRPQVQGAMLTPLTAFGIKVMSIGFLVQEKEAMIWRGPMVMSAIRQLLREVDWGNLDCLVVDMPPGTGDAQLTLVQNVPLTGAIIVSTPQDLALIDARRGITMFQKTNVPILGIVENMSYFNCPHCQGRSEIFSHGGAREEAKRLGVDFLGELPLALQIREQADAGCPTVAADPLSDVAQIYMSIAASVIAKLERGGARASPRITVE